jgi:molybdate transport system substrate-binding protein
VRAALLLVSRGEAPLGIVYESDAVSDPSVVPVGILPDATHPRIIYPIALTSGSTSPDAGGLLDELKSPQARTIFEKQGFTMLN